MALNSACVHCFIVNILGSTYVHSSIVAMTRYRGALVHRPLNRYLRNLIYADDAWNMVMKMVDFILSTEIVRILISIFIFIILCAHISSLLLEKIESKQMTVYRLLIYTL